MELLCQVVGAGAAALDGADLALEFEGALDVAQDDGTGTRARDLDVAVVEHATPQVLLDEDALDLADDDFVGMAVNPAITVEKALVAHKYGRGQVADEATQVQVCPPRESGLVEDGLTWGDNLADFHNLS